MNNKAHLRPQDYDSSGDIIPMSMKEAAKHEQVIRATKWRKQNAKVFSVQCNVFYDDDVIKHLQAQPNKQRYIIELIRKDIERQHTEAVRAKIRGYKA